MNSTNFEKQLQLSKEMISTYFEQTYGYSPSIGIMNHLISGKTTLAYDFCEEHSLIRIFVKISEGYCDLIRRISIGDGLSRVSLNCVDFINRYTSIDHFNNYILTDADFTPWLTLNSEEKFILAYAKDIGLHKTEIIFHY